MIEFVLRRRLFPRPIAKRRRNDGLRLNQQRRSRWDHARSWSRWV